MKSSNKSSIITGTVLLALAAVFSICLLLQLLDFGIGGPGHNNIFYYIGNMLITVYGFSSILIPAFLLISGLSCFATIWTAQKTMRLITAILPFFTCVVTEKICRGALTSSAGASGASGAIKAAIAGVTGLMLIIIEILGAGVIAESVNRKIFYKGKEPPKPAKDDFDDSDDDSIVFVDETETDDSDENENEIEEDSASDDDEEEDSQFKYKKIGAKKSIFDKALDKLKQKKKDESFEALMEEAEELYESNIPTIDDYDNIDKKPAEAASEAPAQTTAQVPAQEEATPAAPVAPAAPAPAASSPADSNDETQQKNPASIISQEEYAALLSEDAPAQESVDELEWNNLPPAPAELPPDYVEDFDENDPALSFSPDELEEKSFAEEMKGPATEEATAPQKDSPYDSARYINSVVTNKSLPYAISLHDENEEAPAQQKKSDDNDPYAAAQSINSKYPRKIHLNDQVPKEEALEQKEKSLDPDFFDIDPNKVPANEDLSDDIEPVPEEMEVDNTVFNQIAKQEKSINFSNVAENVFSDMEEDIRRDAEFDSDSDAALDDDDGATTDTNEEITDFTEFEKDENYDVSDDELFDVDEAFEEGSDETQETAEESLDDDGETSPELNPNAGHANNLTADELTDFFNAQQEENTPQHKVIEGPAPKSHKATKKGPYVIPSDLLTAYKDDQYWIIDDETKQASINLKQTLAEFNIDADIIGIKKGPVVTMFEILPAPGVKLSKIVALQDNIALSLAAQSVRIVAPIPGKQAVGIEVPNRRRSVVGFREIIEMDLPEWNKMKVPVILGKDILGKAQLVDLVKTPHMLIAGATGSGKSVCVNSLILSILYKRSFKDVKLILVDPKVVELKLYNNIPHLLTPVITEPKKAIQALQYCLCEMERRYALLDGLGVRDISSYNERIKERNIATEKLPYIVVIIDEFADLMATSGKELENIVARLTAMSRAVGIHLVLATQRPSTNVITGLIKANIPSRIAFMVASRIDSQIIIDGVGAEKLLGRGDMLYASAVDPAPIRIQGTYLDDNEVEKVVDYVKQYGEPEYIDDEIFVDDDEDEEGNVDLFGNNMDEDPLYDQALEIVVQSGKASASYIQRRLKIGYNRAARLVEEMEERGIVGPANGSKPREIIHIPG